MKTIEYNGKTYLVMETPQDDPCALCDIDCVSILQKGGKFPCFGIEKNEYLTEI